MGRFQLLEREINKGISVDEKSNIVISNWSPNNVRRLIVGFEFAIVQYFRTGSKYPKLVEIVDLRRHSEIDLQQVMTEPQTYKSILTVLTNGRICSSVEEIIFCTTGYNEMLLKLDSDYTKLASNNASLENRFVRLRHISHVPLSVREMAIIINSAKSSDDLLLDVLKQEGITSKALLEQHQSDWWRGSSLRPKYYTMDAEVLYSYFEAVRKKKDTQIREDKLDEIEVKRSRELLRDSLSPTIHVLNYIYDIFDKANEVFERAPILSKAEWADVLQYQNMLRGIRRELIKKRPSIINEYRKIDFDKILSMLRNNEITENKIRHVLRLRDVVFNQMLNSEEYKRESNKVGLSESLQLIQKLTGVLFNAQFSIVFLSLVKYLTRNTPEHARFFFDMLKGELPSLNYSRSLMEYCNSNIEPNWAKSAMDKIGATELLAEQYTLVMKNNDIQKILSSLANSK